MPLLLLVFRKSPREHSYKDCMRTKRSIFFHNGAEVAEMTNMTKKGKWGSQMNPGSRNQVEGQDLSD